MINNDLREGELAFRFTCAHHQAVFSEAGRKGGCYTPEALDELRRRTLAWLSNEYPRAVLDHFNEGSCLGCKLETAFGDINHVLNMITMLATRLLKVGSIDSEHQSAMTGGRGGT